MQINLNDIRNILIIGSGTMGLRIGLQCAMSGYNVVMYDISEEALAKAVKVQDVLAKSFIKEGRWKEEDVKAAKLRIRCTTDMADAAKVADLVSESVIEDIELKKKVYRQFANLFPGKTIITTNTSYFIPSQFADDTGRPERFCALHFHDVFTANVVDVMPHPGTEVWIVDLLKEFSLTIEQVPVILHKEISGYLCNNMLMALLGTAGGLLTSGAGSVEDIDRSWMGNFKMQVGPFGIFDNIGLDTVWHIVSKMKDSKSARLAALLEKYLREGKLGVKSGEGFYKYPQPAYKQEGFLMGGN